MPTETEEFARIASTYRKSEMDEFLSYIWATTFAEWDCKASTQEATQRASEAEARAEKVWREYK